jgi:HSP20 family protein
MTRESGTAVESAKQVETTKPAAPSPTTNEDQGLYELIARRAFEIFESRGCEPGHEVDDWFRAELEMLHPVPINMTESDDDYVVRAEVPGFRGRDIKVDVRLRSLVISGERQRREVGDGGRRVCREWRSDRILRSVLFDADIDTAKVATSLEDGILTVELPKARPTIGGASRSLERQYGL